MTKKIELILLYGLFSLIQRITAKEVIYRLSDDDFFSIPVKNRLDRYEPCVGRTGGVYCTAQADLVSDQPSQLLDMIRAYSAHDEKHFNYSNIMYGLCLTKTCKQFYSGDDSQAALWRSTEACLNDSLAREYNLKARVYDLYCYRHGRSIPKDAIDWAVAAVVLLILALNVAGSCYDFLIRNPSQPGNKYLMPFAVRNNWRYLVAPPSSDPRQVQLRSLNGIRVMTSILVILGHVPIPSVITVDNPSWFEWAYRITLYHVLYQGHLITLTFFFISGLLLTYNLQLQQEKRQYFWRVLPKAVLVRWLRLTPVSLTLLLLSITWFRHTDLGPFWWVAIGQEWRDCRKYWLYNVLYINNLVDHSTCHLQTWSLAADLQLHVIGLAAVLLSPSARARRRALGALYALGVLWPAYHVYTKDLDGSILATPSTIATFFLTSDAFNYVYKRTYSNLPCFVMGMAFGYFVYDLQKRDLIKGDYSRLRFLYVAAVTCLPVSVTAAYFLFFGDAPRAPLLTRVLFAPVIKPLFGSLILLTILGAIYKVETVISGILSWEGWAPLSRVSYCMYTVHVPVVRYLGGTKHTLAYFSFFHMLQEYMGTVVMTIMFATIMHLLVEAPFASLVRLLTGSTPAPKQPISEHKNGVNGVTANGITGNGITANGIKANGITANGKTGNGITANGITANGIKPNGIKKD